MPLSPSQPPGIKRRKARAFAAEICALHAQGYTLDAIREALATTGLDVSVTTVWREVRRSKCLHPSPPSKAFPAWPGDPTDGDQPRPQLHDLTGDHQRPPVTPREYEEPSAPPPLRGGKALAEAFRRSQTTNPFIRAKENS